MAHQSCPRCNGNRTLMGCGALKYACDGCDGRGWVEMEPVTVSTLPAQWGTPPGASPSLRRKETKSQHIMEDKNMAVQSALSFAEPVGQAFYAGEDNTQDLPWTAPRKRGRPSGRRL